MTASGLEVAVEGTLFLLSADWNLARVPAQHHPMRRADRSRLGNQRPVDRGQTGKALVLSQQLHLE